MARNHDDQNTIRQYLLGELDDDERQRMEKRLLTEDLLEEVEIAEDELIDEYLAERLSQAERESFEQNFLVTPERRQKVRFSRCLDRYVASNESPATAALPFWSHFWTTRTWARPATAIAVVVIVAGVFWISRQRTPSPPTYASFTLSISASNRAEGSRATKVTLPINADALRLHLTLPEPPTPAIRYRVELFTEQGEAQALRIVGQDDRSVIVEIPAAQVARGQYALNVYLIQPDGTEQRIRGSYVFTVL